MNKDLVIMEKNAVVAMIATAQHEKSKTKNSVFAIFGYCLWFNILLSINGEIFMDKITSDGVFIKFFLLKVLIGGLFVSLTSILNNIRNLEYYVKRTMKRTDDYIFYDTVKSEIDDMTCDSTLGDGPYDY